ncbi:MAG: single-stranded-DNA-specific exonuclease, partial [Flavobacteriales bacterium]
MKKTQAKIWKLRSNSKHEKIDSLSKSLNIEKTLAQLLVSRGIETFEQAKTFFRPTLEDLHDPFSMKDMDIAVLRLEKAIASGERILIYGDYDVDGTTAVSLMASFLSTIYDRFDTYIPDRYKEGYGISMQGIDYADDNDMSLIIALDCGIKAIEQVAYAKSKGIDFIICDHHNPGNELPDAAALLDPKRKDCLYPFKELSGCGVGFKFAQAYCQKHEIPLEQIYPLLDLLAISIGADIVSMTGENRILTYFGLEQINGTPRAGIRALIENSGKKPPLNIMDVVFGIGPRINAAGRIEHGKLAVEILSTDDLEKAREL